ncbi:MAG TPA: hypothetical protein PKK23_10325 [Nitrospirales bacterium]|nr:hypothetical protein [Nitrospiraceae bacterium]HNP29432.1 hypothetical protein [Nitrospirales bacterium]
MSKHLIFVISIELREEREKELPMTEIIGVSTYQRLLAGVIMAGLGGWIVTASMIPSLTRNLTQHSMKILGVKRVNKLRFS